MFGLVDLVVRAERGLWDKNIPMHSEPRSEQVVWLWRHKMFLLTAASVLALLIIGGNAL